MKVVVDHHGNHALDEADEIVGPGCWITSGLNDRSPWQGNAFDEMIKSLMQQISDPHKGDLNCVFRLSSEKVLGGFTTRTT